MALLKQSIIRQIHQELDNDYFSFTDFDITFPDSGHVLALITFAHNSKYFFRISEEFKGSAITAFAASMHGDKERTPATVECPGDYKMEETHFLKSIDDCVSRISTWCRNIQDDLRMRNPVFREIDELKAQFDAHIEEHISNPEEPISSAEVEAIAARFDDLYAKFEELKVRHEITEAQLRDIRKDFGIIKSNANQYPKGLWAKLTSSRLISLLKKVAMSSEGRKLMYEGAKQLLLGK